MHGNFSFLDLMLSRLSRIISNIITSCSLLPDLWLKLSSGEQKISHIRAKNFTHHDQGCLVCLKELTLRQPSESASPCQGPSFKSKRKKSAEPS